MKKVALLLEGWGRYITNAWINGVLAKIKEENADINLYVFNAYANWSTDERYNQGEHAIFFLPDFCEFDGVICELNNTEAKPVRDEVLEKIRESGTPCIMINAKEDGFYSVGVDNYAVMYDNIRFLYEEKECRSFWFVMGPEENYENGQRTKALLDYAKKKKLKKNVDYVLDYSGFKIKDGRDAFGRLYGKHEVPDVIICANDNLAVGILSEMEKVGLECPRDFYITGFDDLDKARFYDPRISTISYRREDAGEMAVDLFRKLWNGEEVPYENYINAFPIYWESCDCESDIVVDERAQLKGSILWNDTRGEFESDLLKLSSRITHADSIKEMVDVIRDVVVVSRCEDIIMVLDPKFWSEFEAQEEEWIFDTAYINEDCIQHIFPTFESSTSGDCYLFIPIHFREKSAGYLAMKNPIFLMEQQFLFDLINTFLSGMEILYQKECLARANEKLSDLSVKDALTGLYNRLGFGEYAKKMIAKAHKEGRQMLILYSDLDMLKYLNDTYGHEIGDEAIICASKGLKEHVTPDGMCFRLGGDEFLIIDRFMGDEAVTSIIAEIRKMLIDGSREIKLPVDLSMSFGYVVTEGQGEVHLDEYISKADTLMYEDKRRRRKGRI